MFRIPVYKASTKNLARESRNEEGGGLAMAPWILNYHECFELNWNG